MMMIFEILCYSVFVVILEGGNLVGVVFDVDGFDEMWM